MAHSARFLGPEGSDDDPVAAAFTSAENLELLNAQIQEGVYHASEGNVRIGRQSQEELKTIMRSIYLTEARHLQFEVAEQVRELNRSVLGKRTSRRPRGRGRTG
jgi:hypothetical protein